MLKDISFEVKPGETVAVVGATGAGKTTLVNLLERFYDPDSGAVLLDGIDLRKWSMSELRKNIRHIHAGRIYICRKCGR